ncbi:nuclear transport factor 2 family protein [Sphingomonas sp. NSE70-1]|uniref:Nuclear transport factor 2 family protein n=1 Tax=Sphingomonas caseinilyticus TaxID=2908205 RepID=A0ABT0RSL4_9SPHN|nr:nuclear transport factor 2 family protein [Sphingomonas caseinilyticus]MCL6697990.1 nuclear transport factor 2 family protein [Sphingomonas caseinilyticus]
MMKAPFLIAAAVFGLSACKPAEQKAAKVDLAAEEQALRAKESAWMEAYNKHDAKVLTGQYEDDASLAANGTALMTDAVGRGIFLEGMATDPALKVDFASDRVIVAASGDLASSRGHYTMTYTDPVTKQPKTETGNYLTVYRKVADGSWKAVEDFTTPGPAVAAAPAAQ